MISAPLAACPRPRLFTPAIVATALVPPMIALSIAIADVLMSFAALLFLVEFLHFRRDGTWAKQLWFRVALALWIYMCARLMLVPTPLEPLTRVTCWIRYPLFVMAASQWILRDEKAQAWLWRSLALTTCFLAVDAIFQYWTDADLLGHHVLGRDETMRLTGPFTGPIIGLTLTWLSFPVLSVLAIANGNFSARRLGSGICAALVFIVAVWLTGERTAFLMALAGMAMMMLLLKLPKKYLLGAGVAAIIGAGWFAQATPHLIERQLVSTFRVVTHFDKTVYGNLWKTAAYIIMDNPVFGVGPKQFRNACTDYAVRTDDPLTDVLCHTHLHPHNFYLEWFAEYGAIGGLLFLALVALLAREVLRNFAMLRTSSLYIGLLVALFVRFWPVATSPSFFPTWAVLPTWLMLGWAMAVAQNRYGTPKPADAAPQRTRHENFTLS